MHISYFTDFIYQVNPQQTEKLYRKAISCAKLTGKETVIDAYCGTGTIGLIASSRAKHVIGVELNRDAIRMLSPMQSAIIFTMLRFIMKMPDNLW